MRFAPFAALLVPLSLLCFSAAPGAARAQQNEPTYELAGTSLRVTAAGTSREIPLDCPSRGMTRVGSKLYVACGRSGVVRLDLTDPMAPLVDARTSVEGEATQVFVLDGKAWVQVARTEARPAEGLAWSSTVTPQSPPPPSRPPAIEPRKAATELEPEPRPQKKEPESRMAPARRELWEAGVGTSLFLAIGDIGFGAIGHAGVVRRFALPVAVHAELSPLGFAFGKDDSLPAVAGHGIVSLDTQMFELGLGLGYATMNGSRGRGESVSFAQLARIGARDGLALTLRSNVTIVNDEFTLGSLTGSFQVPLNSRWRLLVRGGGGPIGFAFGELGGRYQLWGDGGAGTFAVIGAAGGAAIFGRGECGDFSSGGTTFRSCPSLSFGGPSLSLAFEWRL